MRCAVVSDIHANLEALEAVLDDARDADQVWCLGDIVNFGPQPNECVEALRARGAICIAGNHEEWVLHTLGGAREWSLWTSEELTSANREYLATLPAQVTIGSFTLLHYPHEGSTPPVADDLEQFSSRYCLVGHTHLPLLSYTSPDAGNPPGFQTRRPAVDERVELATDRALVNSGSVGLSTVDPRRANYLLIDTSEDAAPPAVRFRSVPYPVERLISKLRTGRLPMALAEDRERRFSELSPVSRRTIAAHAEWYGDLISAFRD